MTSALGVHFEHAAPHTSKKYLVETMGSGVALFDYDNDGKLDLFLVNGAEINESSPPGTIPKKKRVEILESSLSPEAGWHV